MTWGRAHCGGECDREQRRAYAVPELRGSALITFDEQANDGEAALLASLAGSKEAHLALTLLEPIASVLRVVSGCLHGRTAHLDDLVLVLVARTVEVVPEVTAVARRAVALPED